MTVHIPIPRAALADFCHRRHIRRLALFGSVLRDDFSPDSDVDILVEFDPAIRVRLADLIAAEAELSSIFNRQVDLGEWRSLEEDPNYLRRNRILSTAQVIYE